MGIELVKMAREYEQEEGLKPMYIVIFSNDVDDKRAIEYGANNIIKKTDLEAALMDFGGKGLSDGINRAGLKTAIDEALQYCAKP